MTKCSCVPKTYFCKMLLLCCWQLGGIKKVQGNSHENSLWNYIKSVMFICLAAQKVIMLLYWSTALKLGTTNLSLLHAGTLNAFLKQKGQTTSEGLVWSLSGNQGDRWKQAKVCIHPTASFQVRPKKPKRNQFNTQQHCPLFPSLSVFVWWSISFLGGGILM